MLDPSAFTPPYDHHLCNGLSRKGHQVELVSTDAPFSQWGNETSYIYNPFFYRSTNLLFGEQDDPIQKAVKGIEHVSDMARLIKYVKKVDPDIIHFQWTSLPLVDAHIIPILRRIAPTILTVHDTDPYHGNPPSFLQSLYSSAIPSRFDHLIVHTNYSKRQLINQGFEEKQISVIPHGVLYYDGNEEIQTETSEKTDSCQLLIFGGIKEYKGVDVLIQALACLPEEVLGQIEVIIAGEPRMDISQLKTLAQDLNVNGSIKWDLRRIPDDEVATLFNSSDILILPYRNADQSGVLMSALPFGIPAIATNVGGFSEVITDDVNGKLVPPESPEPMANAIAELVQNNQRRIEMSAEILREARENYSWATISRQTIAVYKRVL